MPRSTFVAAAAVLAYAGTASAVKGPADRVMLDATAYPNARCMDGSTAAYYYQEAPSPATAGKIVFHMQGGGECASYDECTAKTKTTLGSSKYFPAQQVLGFLNDADCGRNPVFCNWTHVHVQYCSQDLHMGSRTVATNDTFGLYFAGHTIVDAIVSTLDAEFKAATEIIVTGDSAGGLGTWPHLRWFANRYPQAKVTGAPVAGFYFYAHPYTGPQHTYSTMVDFTEKSWPRLYKLWDAYIDEACGASPLGQATPWACMLSNYSHPYIQQDVFVTSAQSDRVVLTGHDWIPNLNPNWPEPMLEYFDAWRGNITQGLRVFLHSEHTGRRGAFNPACFIHTDFAYGTPLLDGRDYRAAIRAWYFDEENVEAIDDCGVLCNPTCP